jgi:hypothetical protein
MESAGLAWAQEIARGGFGYLLFIGSWPVIAYLYRSLEKCRIEAREDSKAMTEALVKAAAALDGATDNNKSQIETNKLNTGVLQALIKQVDMSDDRARERAERIVSALERRGSGTRG